jgi:formylmethanofuran dehydrogenase subunit D
MAAKMSKKVTLLTGRSIEQGVALEGEKLTRGYVLSTAVCDIDPEDMKELGIYDGDTVKITTEYGEVLVTGIESTQAPHKNIIFIPMGLYANAVVNPETDSTGMPSYKVIDAVIEPALNEKVLTPTALIKKLMPLKK